MEGAINADVKCNLVVGSNLISDPGLGESASLQVSSKAEPVSGPNQDAVEEAARELVSARLTRRRLARLPLACRPNDFEAALRIQQVVGGLLQERISGWKLKLKLKLKLTRFG
jgi:hypothetical protein